MNKQKPTQISEDRIEVWGYIDELEEKLNVAIEALQFYANSHGLCDNESVNDGPVTHLIAGRRARQALKKIEIKGDNE